SDPGRIAATSSKGAQYGSFSFPPVAPNLPFGLLKNSGRMKLQWQVSTIFVLSEPGSGFALGTSMAD
ncbi:hypothetical protein, partial [Paraburkholderia sp. SIMBA_027]|uniref:hypothetical protein n=1 Tax=Paraburkholderia sp. SIMBA_027 TaxID=3085770 RepID=UPI00397B625E